jgi:hypothetical protein
MVRNRLKVLGVCLALCSAGTAMSDVIIDSEHRAAGGIYTGLRLLDEVPANYALLAYAPRDFTDRALRLLNAAYTPAAVTAQPLGVDVACPAGGAFNARYSKRILDLAFNACVIDIYGVTHGLNGPVQVKLKSDSFAPVTVATLNIGSDTGNFTEHAAVAGSSDPVGADIVRNLRMSGNIQLGRDTVDNNFEGTYSHTLSGFFHEVDTVQLGVPGQVFVTTEFSVTAEPGSSVSGSFSYGDTSWKEDVTLTGTFRQTYVNGTPPATTESIITGASLLRALRSGNYNTGTEKYLVSGTANYSWPAGSGRECHSGGYTFATPVQLTHPDSMSGGFDAWSAGTFAINNAATFTFKKNPNNSPLGEMHVHLDILNAGAFDYDADSLGATSLADAAQCAP